jgi:hypothetical protein
MSMSVRLVHVHMAHAMIRRPCQAFLLMLTAASVRWDGREIRVPSISMSAGQIRAPTTRRASMKLLCTRVNVMGRGEGTTVMSLLSQHLGTGLEFCSALPVAQVLLPFVRYSFVSGAAKELEYMH